MNYVSNTITERMTNVVAAGAVTSPMWYEALKHTSETAALLLPIAGTVWIVVQIVGYFAKDK